MLKTLYIAMFDVGYTHILRVIYAANEVEAQQKKRDLENELQATCRSLEHYPNGFRLVMSTLPGTVEVTEEEVQLGNNLCVICRNSIRILSHKSSCTLAVKR